ncbi:hypothetical protein T552_01963 [Pneumocystis carinii B80]|uniref:DNA-directed RNA polymerase III subunit RPC3 n=1 Tax=Pneumocystis carinii (strain B80) TaxID=1408658 RepID=A0A0W4ZI88_PNEC8|nr:hypothetical protein T552_01963 [Pneumocystis carinii B80]KTW28102.1 hypothetical protein T552_01963 [Pneumocystis carinii B80]
MSQYAIELCQLIIEDFFGQIVLATVNMLFFHGRLSLEEICKMSKIPRKYVKKALVVLIQHNFVLFSTVIEGFYESTYYETTWREILNILRYGREILIISKKISKEAGAILKYIHCHGKVKVQDLYTVFCPLKSKNNEEYKLVQSTITHMLQKRYVRVVLLHQFKPDYDLENDLRNKELEKIRFSKIGEAKKSKEVLKNMKKQLQNLKDEEMDPNLGFKKKEVDLIEQRYKRQKKSGDSSYVIDENVFLRVNHEKFITISRNADLVQLVENRIGKVTAQVYCHILQQLETQNNNNQENTITTMSILQTLPKDIDLSKTFVTVSDNNDKSIKKDSDKEISSINEFYPNEIPDKMAIDTDDFSRQIEEDNISGIHDLNYRERLKHIILHLEALSQDSYPLLFKIEAKHFGKWKVDYKKLSRLLQELEYERIIEHKFGYIATRLLRIIREKGKVDEKQLASIAFLKQQSIRPILMALTEIGALDIQEIPRKSERQPSSIYFLWFHRFERAKSILIDNIYQEISYYHRHLKNELKQRQKLLTKIERTDVQEHEKELLPANEQQELKYIRTIEEKILIQISRLDRLIMILRDY